MKDNFSSGSDQYARYRPGYPEALFDYLDSLVPDKHRAWDCGTGNGQVAAELAGRFGQVDATDISRAQLAQAHQADNIRYSLQPAEKTDLPDHAFDLVIVAQAIHWFDFDAFYAEVRRTAKDGALLVVLGYGTVQVSPAIDDVIDHFYTQVIGAYWDAERRYIDAHYRTIPFPFDELGTPAFDQRLHWSFEHFIGYLNTWSAVRHFARQEGYNPVDRLQVQLEPLWGQAEREVCFPLLLRIGKVRNELQVSESQK